jgi:hypothetical protein
MDLQLPMEEVHQHERTTRTEWCPKGRNPTIMEGYQNKIIGSIRRSTEPKSDPSVSKVVQQTTLLDRSSIMEQSYTQAYLRNIGNPSLRVDTHLLEMKIESSYGFKG